MSRLVLSLALMALSDWLLAIGAQAQNYPARSVTVVVPFAAGGPADITGRIAADIFSRGIWASSSWSRMSAAPAARPARHASRAPIRTATPSVSATSARTPPRSR